MSIQALAWVLRHSQSQGNDRCVMFSLANHADMYGGEIWPGIKSIASEANVSRRTVFNSLERLQAMGEIEKAGERRNERGSPTTIWRMPKMGAEVAPITERVQEMTQKGATSVIKECKLPSPPTPPIKEGTVLNRPEPSNKMDRAKEVIDHFNKVSGKKFTYSESQIKFINARFKDGWSVIDLTLVADYLASRWKDDPKMKEYLRPSTAYRPEKFEGYWNSAQFWAKNGRKGENRVKLPTESIREETERRLRSMGVELDEEN